MKYFTPEIWGGWQGDDAIFDKALKDWDRNLALYKTSLKKLVPRIGLRNGQFFTKHSLHDGHLVAFMLSDWPSLNLKRKRSVFETYVRLSVLAGTKTADIYELQYSKVESVSVQTKNNLFPLEASKFGDWGYDELLPDGRHYFRHNILFQTGTEVSIVFKNFKFTKREASDKAFRQILGVAT